MNRSRILDVLKQSKSTLAANYGVLELALFGSRARDEALRPELRSFIEKEAIRV